MTAESRPGLVNRIKTFFSGSKTNTEVDLEKMELSGTEFDEEIKELFPEEWHRRNFLAAIKTGKMAYSSSDGKRVRTELIDVRVPEIQIDDSKKDH